MLLQYDTYEFSPQLGWSISRYETFDKCKRLYYYSYYGKHISGIPSYKMRMLRDLTSVPLEIGNVVHDVLEAFLKRLRKDDSNIDESRFFEYARAKTAEYFSRKTFLEVYYNQIDVIDLAAANTRIAACLQNFITSPIYTWLFMKAIRSKDNWMVEPEGYGETRLAGMKAYCKMDFLFPVDGYVYILDWKTGKKDEYKHSQQLIGYAAAASSNFHLDVNIIFPKIIYLSPRFEELEIRFTQNDFDELFTRVRQQTDEMLALCSDPIKNIPLPIKNFPPSPSESLCRNCNFQELCFPEKKSAEEVTFG